MQQQYSDRVQSILTSSNSEEVVMSIECEMREFDIAIRTPLPCPTALSLRKI